MNTPSMQRQEYIEKVVMSLRRHFVLNGGYSVPENIRVTVGFPSGSRNRIGECHFTEASTDKHFEIFVSPELGQNTKHKEQPVIEVIAHEICHTIAGYEAGHKAPFKKIATAIGLTGKMTSTRPGPKMLDFIASFEKVHGPYPAGALTRGMIKKKKTYMLKCVCADCGYTVRTTAQWIEKGLPICPVDQEPMGEE
jgi:predicted SprT family Zn-dependent metalloprotease